MISILKCMTSMPCKVDDDYIYLHEDTHYLFVDIIHANSAIEHEFYVSSGPDNLHCEKIFSNKVKLTIDLLLISKIVVVL